MKLNQYFYRMFWFQLEFWKAFYKDSWMEFNMLKAKKFNFA